MLRLQPTLTLSSNNVLPSDPCDPIELTTHHYPYPFLPYSPSLWPQKDPSLPVVFYIKPFQPSRDAHLDVVDKWVLLAYALSEAVFGPELSSKLPSPQSLKGLKHSARISPFRDCGKP
nr:hypothetical protein CFP56_79541 [Quercus suber]